MSRPSRCLTLVLLLGAPMASQADWLVTRDGARVETRGPWRVEGRKVLFTLPNGTLSSLRLDQVDLDRSAVETERARSAALAPAEPAAPTRREPVLRLTDRDLPPVPVDEAGMPTGERAPGSESQRAGGSGLEVANWERSETPAGDGVEIFGTVRNAGGTSVTSPSLLVALYGEDGRLLATGEGRVNAVALPPGSTASFRAVFPGVYDFAAVKFDVQGTAFATRAEASEGEETLPEEVIEEPTEAAPPVWP